MSASIKAVQSYRNIQLDFFLVLLMVLEKLNFGHTYSGIYFYLKIIQNSETQNKIVLLFINSKKY